MATNRDSWAYNFSQDTLMQSMQKCIDAYNADLERFNQEFREGFKTRTAGIASAHLYKYLNDKQITTDPTQISWTERLKNNLIKNEVFPMLTKSFSNWQVIVHSISSGFIGTKLGKPLQTFISIMRVERCTQALNTKRECWQTQKQRAIMMELKWCEKIPQSLTTKISQLQIFLSRLSYQVNGKSAIDWVIERYQITQNKDSLIKNNPNDYSGGKYVFEFICKIIKLSEKSVDLIEEIGEKEFE